MWWSDEDGDGRGDDDEVLSPSFIESGDEDELSEAGGAFTWHISCNNAWPESGENLALSLLSGGVPKCTDHKEIAVLLTVEAG